jgi:hypothetical protein
MSNENPNNHFHWRNKLDDLEYLPGEAFNKEMAWDKLYGRLRGKQSNKKFFWYWVAAACFFFALIITLMNYFDSHAKHLNRETAVKQAVRHVDPLSVSPGNNTDKNVNTVEPKKNISTVKDISHKTIYHPSSAEMIAKVRPNDTISDSLKEPSIKTLPKIDIVPALASTSSSKKKLNVVHINELGDPVNEFPDMVRKSDKHFKIKLANEEVFADPLVVSKTRVIRF